MPENIFDVTDLNELEKLRKVVAKKKKIRDGIILMHVQSANLNII